MLDIVTLRTVGAESAEPLVVKGAKSVFVVKEGDSSSSSATEIMGTFGDGSPAVVRTKQGAGHAVYAAFHPGKT